MTNWVVYARSAAADPDAIAGQVGRMKAALDDAGLSGPNQSLPRVHAPDQRVFVDDGVGGNQLLWERPAGRQLLDYCASHPRSRLKPGFVLLDSWSRLGRHDLALTLFVVGRLDACGWVVRVL